MKSRITSWRARYSIWLSGVCFSLSLASNVWADSAPDMLNRLTLPEGTTLTTVSDSAVHNGLTVAIAAFESRLPPEGVLSFYRQLWEGHSQDGLPGFMESASSGWLMISRLQDAHQIVIQLSTEQNSIATGFVSITPLHTPRYPRNDGVFSSLSLLSSNSTQDGADSSIMRVFASQSSVSETHIQYRDRLLGSGWHLLMDTAVDDGQVMILSRDQSRIELSFLPSREYASVLVAHLVESK